MPGNNGELGYMDFDGRFTSNTIGSCRHGTGDGGADFFLGLPDSFGRGISTTVVSLGNSPQTYTGFTFARILGASPSSSP